MLSTFFKMSMLTAECFEVIGLRAIKHAAGGAAATEEALLMVSEKAEAVARCGPALMSGGSIDTMIDDYRSIVQANAVRLTRA